MSVQQQMVAAIRTWHARTPMAVSVVVIAQVATRALVARREAAQMLTSVVIRTVVVILS